MTFPFSRRGLATALTAVALVGAATTAIFSLASTPAVAPPGSDMTTPTRDYWAYVCAESDDTVSLVRFGPGGLEEVKRIEVGSFPAETEGPHGINLSPDGRYWFVSIAHGMPFGSIHKFSTGDDEWLADATVGMFPATLDISPSTGLLYVVNSDFYGDHVPSSISVVETSTMTEVEQIGTGAMPHGSRLSPEGSRLYSVNMMDDELVEIDALRFTITRRLSLRPEGDAGSSPDHSQHGMHPSADAARQPDEEPPGSEPRHVGHEMAKPLVEPAWVTAPTAEGRIYVTGLTANAVFEVDLASWRVTRRFDTAKGPYNAAVTPDGKLLVVTYKKSDSVGFWDLETGKEVARIDTSRRIPHGVSVTADGRYSMVTVEGIGGEPGSVDVFDNRALTLVDSLDIGKQAGGIAAWQGPR